MIAISLEGSLAGQFVKEAQTLTEGAPAGKVMQCVTHHEAAPQPRLPEPGEDASPPPYEFPPVQFCHREPVDSELWIPVRVLQPLRAGAGEGYESAAGRPLPL
ncbi:hypothetical protein ACFH2V_004086 [Enterobacter kobei]